MNPLSALNLSSVSNLPSEPLAGAGQTAGKNIPAAELAKLAGPGQLGATTQLGGLGEAQPAALSGCTSFSNVLGQMVQEVNGRQVAAGESVQGLLGGGNVSLHQAMIAMEEASVSFQLMVEVRNKLLESYQELMRMQI